MSSLKRKHVNITIQQKLDILKELEKGKSAKQLAFEYNIGCSTVHDIKKNKNKLLNYSLLVSESICGSENRKTMKKSPYELLDRALIHWFNNERAQGKAITGPMCVTQAKILFNTIGLTGNFDASSGWLARFKDRYGIRSVGNSLDCIWTIGVAEPEIFEEETPVLENVEGEAQIEYETIEMECGNEDNEDLMEDEFSTVLQPTSEGALHPKEHIISDGVTIKSLVSQDTSYHKNRNEFENSVQTESGYQKVSENNSMDYEIKNLKHFVEKLEIVTNKLTDLGDNYDHFGRYISLLLKGLPLKKVLYLKQKIVSDVLRSVLAHDKGISEESLSSCNHEFDASCQRKTKTSSNKKLFNGLSRVSVANGTNNSKPYKDVSNLSRLSRKTTQKNKNITTKMYIDSPQSSSYLTSPCSFDNLIPDYRLQDRSVRVTSDHPHFITQRSINNTESAENLSDSSLTYFPVVSVDVSPRSMDTISSDSTNQSQQCIKHLLTASESNQEAAAIQHGPNEDSYQVTIEEPVQFKKEREIYETVVWDTSVKVKVEGPCQNEELEEILPDSPAVELIDCGLCSTQCASRDILVHHFTRYHPGCVPISKPKSYADISSEPS